MNDSSITKLGKFDSWVLASRPKTLPAAAAPVIVGTALAINDGKFNALAATIALICSLLIQIGTNLANDLYDHISGADTEKRHGPQRAAASGILSIGEIKGGVYFTFGMAFLLGLILVYIGGWPIFAIGILSIIAGFAYTAGPYPLAYNGLGDIFVFIFFGFVGTVGTYYVQTLTLTPLAFWASVPVGALITNILVVNNYRDVEEDRESGKNTLAVKFGKRFSRLQYVFFTIISYLTPALVYFTFKDSIWVFLPVLTLPIAIKLVRMIYRLEGSALNETLALTAKLSALYGALFAVGILL